ncbi:MAG TPA: ATP-dependent metallopeptidase FtsH/Yme1/Tma family protein [Myxococcales bacterium]|nr:ATP-dependent metallopeptidase FtsH/Yme1/Tma family protein [Myxococcales bacterium]HIL80237.1 ATP-dependent metallopeptidase FtsH/Yme1/Tma family protein [Myxococcales bacterium]
MEHRVNQQFYKNLALWVVILVVMLLLFTTLKQSDAAPPNVAFSEFMDSVALGEVESVTIEEGHIKGKYTDGREFTTYTAPTAITNEFLADFNERHIQTELKPRDEGSFWRQILIMWFPLVLFIGLWIFFMRQMQGGSGKAMSFGKSKARLMTENQTSVSFKDVAGIEESKTELEEIVEFLREPKKFTRLGGRIPKGVLLVGPPGTGKTLLARAVAGEADVPFFSISGSDFVEMFVGVGASRVRDLFQQGKKQAPCIIFIDEIDAVGRHRGAGMGGGHDEREQTLNQLLVEMDGFESNEGVILIAATNRPDVLDPALLRPGRFDRQVVVPRPDLRGRLEILKIHTRRVPLADDVDLEVQARGTPGMVGADLQNLVNEAALLAARRDGTRVSHQDFEDAKDKVLMGSERRSMIMSDEDKRTTAFHEAGHALVALLTPEESDPVHKVTIIPRGMALGLTQTLPVEDRLNYTQKQIYAVIRYAMGGRAAEDIVFGHFSTGASNDLQQATDWARRMVTEYGMSEGLGPVSYSTSGSEVFLGRDLAGRKDYSEQKAREIDDEIAMILTAKYEEARQLLLDNRDLLNRVTDALLERETLEGSDLAALLRGEVLPDPKPAEEEKTSNSRGNHGERDEDSDRADNKSGGGIPDPEPMPS